MVEDLLANAESYYDSQGGLDYVRIDKALDKRAASLLSQPPAYSPFLCPLHGTPATLIGDEPLDYYCPLCEDNKTQPL